MREPARFARRQCSIQRFGLWFGGVLHIVASAISLENAPGRGPGFLAPPLAQSRDVKSNFTNHHSQGDRSNYTHLNGITQPGEFAWDMEKLKRLCYLKRHIHVELVPNNLHQRIHLRTCAAVSNSGAMLAHDYGAEIDAHTAVFRFNSAPTSGFEHFVGRRESVRVTNQRGFDTVGKQPFPHAWYMWADNREPFPAELQHIGYTFKGIGVKATDPIAQFGWTVWNLFSERSWKLGSPGQDWTPTTGGFGVIAALALCDYVDIYEMYPSAAAEHSKYHYWNSANSSVPGSSANDNNYHITFDAERALWGLISITPSKTIYATGKLTVPGFRSVDCAGVGPPNKIP